MTQLQTLYSGWLDKGLLLPQFLIWLFGTNPSLLFIVFIFFLQSNIDNIKVLCGNIFVLYIYFLVKNLNLNADLKAPILIHDAMYPLMTRVTNDEE